MQLKKLAAIATAISFMCVQSLPAAAYGPAEASVRLNDVRAMVNFRIPLGAFQGDKDGAPSFGFTVKRQFQFNDPLHETMSGANRNSEGLTVNAMDLRFETDGKLRGLNIGDLNTLQFSKTLNAAANGGGGGLPNWVWWALGGAVVIGVLAAVGPGRGGTLRCPDGTVAQPGYSVFPTCVPREGS